MTDAELPNSADEHFDQFAADYDASAEWCLDDTLSSSLTSGIQGKLVLDIGCGTGLVLRGVLDGGGRGMGLDRSMAMLRVAAKRVRAPLVLAVAEHPPFRDAVFDAVVCRQVLHYTREAETLAAVFRMLRPGGDLRLAQVTSAGEDDFAFWSVFKSVLQPLRRRYYTAEFLVTIATLCGFDVVDVLRSRVRRHYSLATLFRRTPLDAAGQRRMMKWLATEAGKHEHLLEPVITENEVVLNQYWTVLIARAPRGTRHV